VCANVANLMVARLAGRSRELALRAALGAGRARLVRQLLTESVILALAGGIVGLAIAVLTRDLMAAFVARFTMRAAEIAIDRTVLLFALVISVATGIVFGTVPILSVSTRSRIADGFSRRTHRMRQLLVTAQVAISLVLLIGAGLMARSFLNLRAVDGGFDADRVLTAIVDLDWTTYDNGVSRREYFRSLIDRLGAQPGVEAAALSLTFPLNDSEPFNQRVLVDGGNRPTVGRLADFRLASPEYFRAVGMSLLRGRAFSQRDRAGARPVAIVNLSMARHYFGGADPVGRRLSLDNGRTWQRVVGVVNDVRQYGLATEPADEVYLPFDQRAPLSATLVLRTTDDPIAMWRMVQRVAREIDPRQPISRPQTLQQVRSTSIASPRVMATLVGLFAIVALAVTAAGIAGVVSSFVAQRTTEIGVRRALGAPRAALVRLVAIEGLAPVAIGLAVGAGASLLTTRVVARLLFAVRPTDAATYSAVVAMLSAVAAVACAIPARRAASIEPAITLRAD